MAQYSDEDIEEVFPQEAQQVVGDMTDTHFFNIKEYNDINYIEEQMKAGNTRGYTSRNWCFTWNNVPHSVVEGKILLDPSVNARFEAMKGMKYLIYGIEVAPKTKTVHLQGYVNFISDRVFGKKLKFGGYKIDSLKGEFPECYWKPMFSTPEACIKYCKKDGSWKEFGDLPSGQGKDGVLVRICSLIVRDAIDMKGIIEEFPIQYVRYGNGIRALYTERQPHREGRPITAWLVGASGVGKTDYAFRTHGRENVYIKPDGTQFWNGYDQQDAVIINEFSVRSKDNPSGWVLLEFLQLLDSYPHIVEIKGDYRKFNSPSIYITSPKHPKDYFKEADLIQVLRRVDMIYYIEDEATAREDTEYQDWFFDEEKVKPCSFTLGLIDKRKSQKKILSKSARLALNRLQYETSHNLKSNNLADLSMNDCTNVSVSNETKKYTSATSVAQYSDED